MAIFQFASTISGLPIVVSKLKAVRAGIVAFIGKKRIERYLVARTKSRFEERGSNPLAQRSPDGQFWAWAKQGTVAGRYGSNKSRTRALFDKGNLQRSIAITKKGPGLAIIGRGGTFVVGVRANSPAAKYALFQQRGGKTPTGGVTPPRPFLGVGRSEAEELAVMGKELIEKRL